MNITRRNFLKIAGLSLISLGFKHRKTAQMLVDFPEFERLGRICAGMVEIKSQPNQDSQTVGVLYEDAVVAWLREAVGPKPYYINQRWVETPDGYIYAPYVQPVKNIPNQAVTDLIPSSLGNGLWAEITIPYVDTILQNTPSSNSWVSARTDEGMPIRLYYGQVFWIDQIKTDDEGKILYRVNPNYYGGVDMLWAEGKAFKPITPADLTPINPEIENKRVVVDVIYQTLSCYENDQEVYFCRVSTGAKYDAYGNPVDKWSTPLGKHQTSRKYISLQMSGGVTGAGYDLPGIGWTSIFASGGVAIHATVWHNDFGVPRSHGCVNLLPEDARWIFRWTNPTVSFDPGMIDIAVSGGQGTTILVVEGGKI